MLLSSVRDLKLELLQPLTPPGDFRTQQPDPSASTPADWTPDVARVLPGLALGIAGGARGNYRLAVRIQPRDWQDSAVLEGIVAAAHGEVEVQYIGELSKQHSDLDLHRRRPVRPGTSVGHYKITSGTLGTFIRLSNSDRPRILSNNHVLANENRGRAGDAILQPGFLDGGRLGNDRIASLERFVVLDNASVNYVDAALALLDSDVKFDPLTEQVSVSGKIADIERVERVHKRGRTTGLTTGVVTAIEVDNVVVRFSTGFLRFDNQVEVTGSDDHIFSLPGDSGSLIVEEKTGDAVGLLFAGTAQGGPFGHGVTYANPITEVLRFFPGTEIW